MLSDSVIHVVDSIYLSYFCHLYMHLMLFCLMFLSVLSPVLLLLVIHNGLVILNYMILISKSAHPFHGMLVVLLF